MIEEVNPGRGQAGMMDYLKAFLCLDESAGPNFAAIKRNRYRSCIH